MGLIRRVNRFVMVAAIASTLALGILSAMMFGIGTSPGRSVPVADAGQPAVAGIYMNFSSTDGESQSSGYLDWLAALSF
jgi:hypothetical protein